MKIGIVLSRPPGYSETFIVSKIKVLQEKGAVVELFVDNEVREFNLCKQFVSPSKNKFHLVFGLLRLIITKPHRVVDFIKRENDSGRSLMNLVKNLLNSIHLLNSTKLNWVHFGFAALVVGKENVASAIGARMSVSFRGYDISRFPLKNPGIYNILWTRVNKVHSISRALLNKALKYGLPSSVKTEIIYPAVDINIFNEMVPMKRFSARVEILTVCRLEWMKGLEYSLIALKLLFERGVDFQYTIIGEGSQYDRLIIAANDSGISDKICFKGKVAHSKIKEEMLKADIYLQYSIQEGFCNSALEAQALGLPCIVSDAEGLPENVSDNITGWVVPRREPLLLAEKIIKVIKLGPSDRYKIQLQAVERVHSEFNLTIQAEKFNSFFNID